MTFVVVICGIVAALGWIAAESWTRSKARDPQDIGAHFAARGQIVTEIRLIGTGHLAGDLTWRFSAIRNYEVSVDDADGESQRLVVGVQPRIILPTSRILTP